jgi:hypothetical protein
MTTRIRIPAPGGHPDEIIADLVKLIGPSRAIEALAEAGLRIKLEHDDSISNRRFDRAEAKIEVLTKWARGLARRPPLAGRLDAPEQRAYDSCKQ